MDRRLIGIVGATAAVAAGLAWRRGLRGLEAADADHDLDPGLFRFPAGSVAPVTTSDGASIMTEMVGAGPAVVLVHGITSSRHDFGPVAHRLLDLGCTVIGVEQRGHGESTVGADGFGAPVLGQDLAQIVTELDLDQIVLVGHSMGGIAAMTFAVDHPDLFAERVAGMVLVATTPETRHPFRRPLPKLVAAILRLARTNPPGRRLAVAGGLFGRFGSATLVEAALASARRVDPANMAACAAALGQYDIVDRLPSITGPVRCIYGTHDVVTPAAANRTIASAIPGAEAEEIAGAGHVLIWTHVDEVVDQIVDVRPTSA